MNNVAKAAVPAGVAGGAIGTTALTQSLGIIPPAVAYWLWPSLFLTIFLVATILLVLKRATWPASIVGLGAVVQAVGMIFLIGGQWLSEWTPLWYSLGAMAAGTLLVFILWGVSNLRARNLEKKIQEGFGGADPTDLGRIRKSMSEALELLRRAGKGRDAIYRLPWVLVMGRPSAGKTVAIKESNLNLPVKKDWVKGVGGTYTCDWFFTNELIFLDTPGKWVIEGAEEEAQDYWTQLLDLLARFRARRPLDGLIVVVPTEDLVQLEPDVMEERAANIRHVIDTIYAKLGFRFPIYLLLTKCDLIEGFVSYAKNLPPQRRNEVFGWSNPNPNEVDPVEAMREAFDGITARLKKYRLEMLGSSRSRTEAGKLFFFPEELQGLVDPLQRFADVFFRAVPGAETPVFRGLYLSSGMREGTPMSIAMQGLASRLGVPARKADTLEEDDKRGYFLYQLFRDIVARDDGLVGRTAGHWWKRRRNTMFGAFAPALLAVLVLILSVLSFAMNSGVYKKIETEPQQVLAALEQPDRDILQQLDETGKLLEEHRKLDKFSFFRSFGMRRPGELEGEAFELFQSSFVDQALRPTLGGASDFIMDKATLCSDAIDLLRSVVWLRRGEKRPWGAEMAGIDRVWFPDVDAVDPKQRESFQRELLQQYWYLNSHEATRQGSATLLPGFSIEDTSTEIARRCGNTNSKLARFSQFADACRDPDAGDEVRDCYRLMQSVFEDNVVDLDRFAASLTSLRKDLEEIKGEEDGAREALEQLAGIEFGEETSVQYLRAFEDNVYPSIRESLYLSPEDVSACRQSLEEKGPRELFKIIQSRAVTMSESEGLAQKKLDAYLEIHRERLGEAGVRTLSAAPLRTTALAYLHQECAPGSAPRPQPVVRKVVPRKHTPRKSSGTKKQTVTARYQYFENPKMPARSYRPSGLAQGKMPLWQEQLDSVSGPGIPASMRADEESRVRSEVTSYARQAKQAWIRYLGSLELKAPQGSLGGWVAALAESREFEKVLKPLADAVDLGKGFDEAPFDQIQESVESLADIEDIVESTLPDYKQQLKKLAADLARCESGDSAFYADFQRGYQVDDEGNSLVQLKTLIQRKVAPRFDGSLTAAFSAPVKAVEGMLFSGDLTTQLWQSVGATLDQAGSDIYEWDDNAWLALLGGESGLVPRLAGLDASEMTAEERRWIDHLAELSALLFEEDSDEFRVLRWTLELPGESFDSEKLDKQYRVAQIRVALGDEGVTWEEGAERSKKAKFAVLGEDAPDRAYVQVVVDKKRKMMKLVGKKWKKDNPPVKAAAMEGPLAALKTLIQGAADPEAVVEAEEAKLVFSIEVTPEGEKVPAILLLQVRVTGEGVGALLDLARSGVPSAPQVNSAGGGS